jgi:nitrate reductase gamma subunit
MIQDLLLPVVLPWLSAVLLLAGLAWRLGRWLRAKARPAPLFPAPAEPLAAWAGIAAEVCLLGGRRTVPTPGLVAAWCLHAALVLLAVGHVRAVADFPGLWAALGLTVPRIDRLGAVAGGAAGLVALAATLALALRRIAAPAVRRASRPADFLVLALLAAVLVSGLWLRLDGRTDLPAVRTYLVGLLSLHPGPLPASPGFTVHFLSAQALAVVFPWSKLLHAFGVFPAKAGLGDRPGPAAAARP